jgi:predicted TIM-barrel fold metal-dependent hydrolase
VRGGFRIFDTHTHIGSARHSGRRFTGDDMLRHMDAAGIERSMLIPFPVVEDHRREHDEIGAAVKAHPDRFAGAACLNPFLPPGEFRDEMRRCREQLGFRAWKVQPQFHGLNPLSRRNDALFETAVEFGYVLICHTGSGVPFALPSLWMSVAGRFPALPVVLGHAGGGIYAGECIVAASFCPNIFIELSSLMPHHILEILHHVPAARLMAGSDLPESVEVEIDKVVGLPVSAEDRQAILWDTPRRLFDGA